MSEYEEVKFAKFGFVNKPWPLINRVRAGEIALTDVVAISQRNLNVQMKEHKMRLDQRWIIHDFIDGARGACKFDLERAGSRKEDTTAKYVIFFTSAYFPYKIPLDQYRNVVIEEEDGTKRRSSKMVNIVPKVFKIIDDFLEGNTGMMWPYIDAKTGEFGVTFESEFDGVLFSAMVDV